MIKWSGDDAEQEGEGTLVSCVFFSKALSKSRMWCIMWPSQVVWIVGFRGKCKIKFQLWGRKGAAARAGSRSAVGRPNTELMRSKRLLCDICRLTLELWSDEAPSIWAISWNCRQISGITYRGKETDVCLFFYSISNCVTQTLHVSLRWSSEKQKWERAFYLDYDELFLQSFPIRKLLPEAHVDGVSRRAAVVVFELFQFWTHRYGWRR